MCKYHFEMTLAKPFLFYKELNINMFELRYHTPLEWTEIVLKNFNRFLLDHAAAEKKASGMAMSMLSHYPDRPRLVKAMVDLSIEELTHFRDVVKIILDRGLQLEADSKDLYINQFRSYLRKESEAYLLDRLLTASIIEARGCERFGLISTALEPGGLKNFYGAIADSESRHQDLFIHLAKEYFKEATINQRLDELLDIEANIVNKLPWQATLH